MPNDVEARIREAKQCRQRAIDPLRQAIKDHDTEQGNDLPTLRQAISGQPRVERDSVATCLSGSRGWTESFSSGVGQSGRGVKLRFLKSASRT